MRKSLSKKMKVAIGTLYTIGIILVTEGYTIFQGGEYLTGAAIIIAGALCIIADQFVENQEETVEYPE